VSNTLHGGQAVKQVTKNLGRELTRGERRVVMEEGYSVKPYRDTVRSEQHPKGVLTGGVGQTGKWLEKGFEATYNHHVKRAKAKVPDFDDYPEYLQAELVQSEYRGDLGHSPTAMRLLREGKHAAAAEEFLDNDEYRNPKTSPGIKKRMKATSDAIKEYGREKTAERVKQTTGLFS
jgi:hypothetical protein